MTTSSSEASVSRWPWSGRPRTSDSTTFASAHGGRNSSQPPVGRARRARGCGCRGRGRARPGPLGHLVEPVGHRGRRDVGGVGQLAGRHGAPSPAVARWASTAHSPCDRSRSASWRAYHWSSLRVRPWTAGDHPLHRLVAAGGDVGRDRCLVLLAGRVWARLASSRHAAIFHAKFRYRNFDIELLLRMIHHPRRRNEAVPMRARLLILASAVAMLGWGTVLPYQYAYAANTRGWGTLVAAAASSLFSVGRCSPPRSVGAWPTACRPVAVAVARQGASPPPAPAAWSGAGSPASFLARHVRLRRRDHRRGPGPVGAGAALGRRRGPPARLRLAVHRAGARHGRGRLRRRLRVDLDRADGMWPASPTAPRASSSRPCSSSSAGRRLQPGDLAAEPRPAGPGGPGTGDGAARDLGHPGAALDGGRHRHPRARLLRPVRERVCRPTPSPCSTSRRPPSGSPRRSTASSSSSCRWWSCG